VSVKRLMIGLIAMGLVLILLTEASHIHGLPGIQTSDDTLVASSQSFSFSAICPVCLNTHLSPALTAGCFESLAPNVTPWLYSTDTTTLPSLPVPRSNASRAPPAHHILGV